MIISEIFKALSDENRIRIFNLLQDYELCVCEIETILNLSQTNASRHLAKLKSAGILEMRKEYQWAYYKIAEDFVCNNRILIDYLIDVLKKDVICVSDLLKLKKFKECGFNCEKIKLNKADVVNKINKL